MDFGLTLTLDPRFMLRLLRAYAHTSGAMPFKHRRPTPLTDLVQPPMQAHLQESRAEAKYLPPERQVDRALADLSFNTIVMMGTGLFDTVGSVADGLLHRLAGDPKPLAVALEDLCGDIGNLAHFVATRGVQMVVDGVPGEIPYDKTMAVGEWGIAAASLLSGANKILSARPPMPKVMPVPVMLQEFAPQMAMDGSAVAVSMSVASETTAPTSMMASTAVATSATPMGVRDYLRTDPEEAQRILKALQDSGGNQSKAAEALGIRVSRVNRYVNGAAEGTPLAAFKTNRPKGYSQKARGLYDGLIKDLRAANGNLHRAAEATGASVENLSQTLMRAKKRGAPGAKEINPIKGRPEGFTDAELQIAMDNNNNIIFEAANELGAKPGTVSRRWKLLNIPDEKILGLLQSTKFDVILSARLLKVNVNDIFARIRRPDTLLNKSVQITKDKQVILKQSQ